MSKLLSSLTILQGPELSYSQLKIDFIVFVGDIVSCH